MLSRLIKNVRRDLSMSRAKKDIVKQFTAYFEMRFSLFISYRLDLIFVLSRPSTAREISFSVKNIPMNIQAKADRYVHP